MKKRFGEIATFSRGLTFSKGDVVSESSKRVLRSNNIDIDSHSLVIDDIACLKESFVIPNEKMLHRNDIFICMSNGSTQHLGKVAFISEEIGYAFGGFMGAIHPDKSQIFPKYAFYACLSSEYRRFLASIFNGVNINNLKWSDLSDFRIPMLPLAEQERIVAELDLLQGIIDKQKAQLKELDTLAQSIFYDMFQHEHGQVVKLHDVCSIVSGLVNPNEEPYCNYPHIGGANIESGTGVFINVKLAKEENLISGKYLFDETMILYSKIRPNLNKVALPSFVGICSADMYPIIPDRDRIDRTFLKFVLSQPDFLEYAISHSGRANIPKINREDLMDYSFMSYSLSLQQSFATKIEAIEHQKASINASIAETQKLFDYTMDKYFG